MPAEIGYAMLLEDAKKRKKKKKKKKKGEFDTLLDLCVSSLRRGHANLLCIVPILTDASEEVRSVMEPIHIYTQYSKPFSSLGKSTAKRVVA